MGIDPISIGVMAAGVLVSAGGQAFSAFSQSQQLKAQQRMADVEAQNARLDQVRQARIKRAQIMQSGENQGAGGSSSVVGGAQGVVNQAESNIQYIGDQQSINHAIIKAKNNQLSGEGITQLGAGITKLGGVALNNDVFIQKKAKDIFGLDIPLE